MKNFKELQAQMSPERQQKNTALAVLSQLQQLAAQARAPLETADLSTLDYEAMFHELLLELERVLNTPADRLISTPTTSTQLDESPESSEPSIPSGHPWSTWSKR